MYLHRLKGSKKDEQYKLVWSELEIILQNSLNSPEHKAILQSLQECRSRGGETSSTKAETDSSR